MSYPIVAPNAQTAGINAKASARFVLSVSSPIVLLMTPVFRLINCFLEE